MDDIIIYPGHCTRIVRVPLATDIRASSGPACD
jgi:hypothetical protein